MLRHTIVSWVWGVCQGAVVSGSHVEGGQETDRLGWEAGGEAVLQATAVLQGAEVEALMRTASDEATIDIERQCQALRRLRSRPGRGTAATCAHATATQEGLGDEACRLREIRPDRGTHTL